jgi:hypothetical protein
MMAWVGWTGMSDGAGSSVAGSTATLRTSGKFDPTIFIWGTCRRWNAWKLSSGTSRSM